MSLNISRTLIAALGLSIGFSSVHAIADETASEQKVSIWRIDDEDSTVFLAGSIHLLREEDYPLPPAFDRVYEQSDRLIFELDMANMHDPAVQQAVQVLGALPEGEILSDLLEPDTISQLRDYLAAAGLSRDAFDRLTPGMIFLSLSSLEATRSGARPDLGLEVRYYRKSVNDGKPSEGLETAASQLSMLSELDPDVVDALITSTIEDFETFPETMTALVAAWKTGSSSTITELVHEPYQDAPEFYEALLTKRNQDWIDDIEAALATEEDVMVLVGAAHHVGKDSVIELLKKRGLSPKQLSAAGPQPE